MNAAPAPVLVVAVNGQVIGLHPQTGQRLWAHDVGGPGVVELAIGNDRVFAISLEPRVTCIEYPGGRLLGTAELPSSPRGWRLLLQDGLLYVVAAGHITCVSSQGQVLWQQELSDMASEFGQIAMGFPNNVRPVDRKK